MDRSIGTGALVTTFAWASFAWAQQPIASSASVEKLAPSPGQCFSVLEPGKAIQKCKVIQAWETPEGQSAYQVQALDTGEMMTIVTTGEATNQSVYQAGKRLAVQAVPSRIFHWGSDWKRPPGTPMPPTLARAAPRPEVAKMTSAVQQPAKLTAPAQSKATKLPLAARTGSTRSTIPFPWFSRASETREVGDLEDAVTLGKPTSLGR
jgi:hypothetical protein